ncbi:MAG TPA: hypothetical protein VGK19_18890 [Capsulimonadaceae bacterium]|jgi:hypothetical protein
MSTKPVPNVKLGLKVVALFASVIFIAGALASPANATIYNVNTVALLQTDLALAVSGDTIKLADGSYSFPAGTGLKFASPGVTLTSVNGPTKTTIQIPAASRAFLITSGSASISGITFTGSAGAKIDFGGAIEVNSTGNPSTATAVSISNCVFVACTADVGGAIDCDSSILTVSNCVFQGNVANASTGYGGAIMVSNVTSASPASTISNSLFVTNSAGRGGSLAVAGVLNATDRLVTVIDCSFTNNKALVAPAGGAASLYYCAPLFQGCILWSDGSGEISNQAGATPAIQYCDIQGGIASIVGATGSANINADPLFVTAPSGSNYGDLHLQDQSPCIGGNTGPGQPLKDFDGVTRGAFPAIGAYTHALVPRLLRVTAPAAAAVGSSPAFTVTSTDLYGHTVTTYTGTVHITSSDPSAVLPADNTLVNGTKSFNATLNTSGSQTISATDTVVPAISGTSNPIAVSGVATHFAVSVPPSASAGTPVSITVTALDASNNVAGLYTGTVHFTSNDGSAVLPANTTLVNGVKSLSVTFKTAGSRTLTATDTVAASINGTSAAIAVAPTAVTHLAVIVPASATAGAAFTVTVNALDAYNNTATGYTGTVHFTSTDPAGVLPANSTLVNGVKSFSVTMKTSGSRTITATDTVTYTIAGTSAAIPVSPGPATRFVLTAPDGATAGLSFVTTVTAKDAYNNTATNYAGTVHLTSTDSAAVLPADATLTNGVKSYGIVLKTAGSRTLTATDTVTPATTGTSSAIGVVPAATHHLLLTAPASATAGASFALTVTAKDAYNNTTPTYTGVVHLTSTDSAAVLPADTTLVNGTKSFSVALKTAGSRTISATDTSVSTIKGVTGAIAVNPGPIAKFVVTNPASATAGTAFTITVTAKDAVNNTTPSYAGMVHFTSTDSAAVLPADAALVNGTKMFTVVLKTTGSRGITAADSVTPTIKGSSSTITVVPGATTRFVIAAPASSTAGSAFGITVTAKDAANNTTPAYSGTVHFTSTDSAAVLPADATLVNGVKGFSMTLKTAGSRTITAADTVTAAIKGTSSAITVNPGPTTRFVVAVPASITAGSAFGITVTAKDSVNNTTPAYSGTVHITSSDSAAVLPADATLVNGVKAFSVTLKTAGSRTVTATDTVTAATKGTSSAITVNPGPTTHFVLTAPGSVPSGTAFSVTVTAKDAANNTTPLYAGTVHFTSTDPMAILPADTTLASGVMSLSVTLKTTGSRTITSTDTVTAAIKATSGPILVN